MFCTVLNYICLRMLGEGPNGGRENACKRARQWILDRGGVTYIPSWGKIWLSVNLSDLMLISLKDVEKLRVRQSNFDFILYVDTRNL